MVTSFSCIFGCSYLHTVQRLLYYPTDVCIIRPTRHCVCSCGQEPARCRINKHRSHFEARARKEIEARACIRAYTLYGIYKCRSWKKASFVLLVVKRKLVSPVPTFPTKAAKLLGNRPHPLAPPVVTKFYPHHTLNDCRDTLEQTLIVTKCMC